MFEWLWLIVALPLAGFVMLALFGARMPRRIVALAGTGTVGLAALIILAVGLRFLADPPEGQAFTQTIWTWFSAYGFAPKIAFLIDPLSLLMASVVLFVGFLIHLYSAEYMIEDEGYSRFFAYMNLFVASMLTLVLADNLLLLYLGWEGVGLCSYLLIGFWYKDPANGAAARKAFIVTRVGDTAFAIGIFLLFTHLGTLDIRELMARAPVIWHVGAVPAVAAAALLLGGAVGKSAQLPLQTWLPDAMAGPTPVSALIHAATMVTAGVYLICRTHVLFSLAPAVQAAVGVIGALTLLLAGASALAQHDIKRVLAYSTMSQIGYMFLAMGAGAYYAAMFHFMTHAFFKALLFLAAGVVIVNLHEEHDIFKMGGLRKKMPVVFWTFLIGGASLAGFPLVTAGFYSKDLILWQTWSIGPWLWLAGIAGALLTSIYIFRVIFIVFFGEEKIAPSGRQGYRFTIPLVTLAVLSVISGFVELPAAFNLTHGFSRFISAVLPIPAESSAGGSELLFMGISAAVSLFGIFIAYLLYYQVPRRSEVPARSSAVSSIHRFGFAGWGFDWIYGLIFIRPFVWIARINKSDFIDLIYTGIALVARVSHKLISRTQSGLVRRYAAAIAIGAVLILAVVVLS